ncbi:RING finger domain-containing protein [Pelagibacteraceae bacterium]|nr:RING finger domain-containing protein [Pelagibacteraceae bacterium]
MNRNLFNSTHPRQTQSSGISTNEYENTQRSVNDLVHIYRNLTHGMRDVMVGYNNTINSYNQNISRYLSTINEYRNDVRLMQSQISNDLPQLSRTNTPTRPSRAQPSNIRHNTTNTYPDITPVGTTESRTFSSPSLLFPNNFTFPINFGTRSYENVIVSPTQSEIDNAVEVFNYNENSMQLNGRCPITMEEFVINDRVSRIRHCGHLFREEALNRWFRLNVRCPVCRYDIREYTNNNDTPDTTDNNTMDASDNNIDISNSNIDTNIDDITNQVTNEITNLLTQAWRTQLQSNLSDNSQNQLFSFDIPISITSTYVNEYDEDEDMDADDDL